MRRKDSHPKNCEDHGIRQSQRQPGERRNYTDGAVPIDEPQTYAGSEHRRSQAAPDDGFAPLPGRDASASVRGYLYQAERTVLAWLKLDEQTVLYCECGEDIDYVQLLPSGTSSTPVVLRLVEQVKLREGKSVTLRSEEAIEALANFLAVSEANPGLRVLFRFFTNAAPGKEQGIVFPGGTGGIEAWEQVRATGDQETGSSFVQALRSLFASHTWLENSAGARVAAFLKQTDDIVVRDLIMRFEWAIGSAPAEKLRPMAEARLIQLGLARSAEQADEVYRLLLLHALRTIASPGPKRLDRATLLELVEKGTLTAVDRDFLRELRDLAHCNAEQIAALAECVSALSTQQADVYERINVVEVNFARLTRELVPGIPTIGTARQPRRDEPPLQPALYAPRSTLVGSVAARLRERTWVGLRGTAWMGKTQVARAVWEQHSGTCCWITLRGQPEQVAAHLVDQLLLWHSQTAGEGNLAESYARGQIGLQELAKAVASSLGPDALLVLDDVSDVPSPDIRDRLASLAAAFRQAGHRILSTSQVTLPREVKDALGADWDEYDLPPMDKADVEALLSAAGASDAILTDNLCRLVVVATGGHPIFVAATARAMSEANWNVDGKQIRALLVGEPFQAERQQARRAVTQLTRDPQARDLLDRLSIMRASFAYPMVTILAGVSPEIARPHESLHVLVGRWVDVVPTARYQVTPLLQGTGADVLAPDLCRALHAAAAQAYLEQRILDTTETWEASWHLSVAQDWLGLARFILGLARETSTAEEARAVGWIPLCFIPGTVWPTEIPHMVRIVVRAVQARNLLLQHRLASAYEADLEQLIAAAGMEDAPAIAAARYLTALPEAVPAAETARRALEAARAVRRMDPVFPDFSPVLPEQLFWAAGLRMRGASDLAALVPVIRSLTPEERRIVFAAEPGYDGAIILIELAYSKERAATGPVDWAAVEHTLLELERLGQLEDAEPLRAAALRVRALMLADVHHRPNDALVLLDQHSAGARDETRFVLEGTRACILLANNRPDEAYAVFEAALALRGADASPFLRNECSRRGAEAAGQIGRWERAREWCLQALHAARANHDRKGADEYVEVELLAELAWIYWQSGRRGEAARALAVAVRHLMKSSDPTSARFRETFGRVRFLQGWLFALATTGAAPVTPLGSPPPDALYPGFTRTWNPDLSTLNEKQFLPERLLQDVARIAVAINHPWLAAVALASMVRVVRAAGDEEFAGLSEWERAYLESHCGAVEAAVSAAVAAVPGITLARARASGDAQARDAEVARRDLDPATKAVIERAAMLYPVILGSFLRLAANDASTEDANLLLDRLAAAIDAHGAQLHLREHWLGLIDHLRRAFSGNARRADLAALPRNAGGEDEQLVLAAVLARCPDALPEEITAAQGVLFTSLLGSGISGTPIRRDAVRWIVRVWRRQAAERGFALHAPRILRDAVAAVPADSVSEVAAARLLLAAADASGGRLDAGIRATLRQLATQTED